jgi:hypothetical protein
MSIKFVVPTVISRREFMKRLGRVFGGGILICSGIIWPLKKSIAYPPAKGETPMDQLTYSTFSDIIGETFLVRIDSAETISAELIEATDHTAAAANKETSRQECFSILFRGPLERPVEQGTYTFNHRRFGDIALFIVPVGMDDKGRHYEAVVNRLRA